ncbi:MAG: ECF transporter S component [Micrococcaceae bacterium]
MSMFPPNNQNVFLKTQGIPQGTVVARYQTYIEAQVAVDYLADRNFPVRLVSIVGTDLKQVEQVTGRLTLPRVALSGAFSGMWFGLFIGVLMSFSSNANILPAAIAIGAAMGILLSVVTHAMNKGRRDFTSMSRVVASVYEVIVDDRVARDANKILHQMPKEQQVQFINIEDIQKQQTQHQQETENLEETESSSAENKEAAKEDNYKPKGEFKDLDDGRPRFGVRIKDADNQDKKAD